MKNTWTFRTSDFRFKDKYNGYEPPTKHINQPTSLAMRAKSLFSLGEGEE
jgi:hypothetical protein